MLNQVAGLSTGHVLVEGKFVELKRLKLGIGYREFSPSSLGGGELKGIPVSNQILCHSLGIREGKGSMEELPLLTCFLNINLTSSPA